MISIAVLAAAMVATPIEEEPFLRRFYFRAGLGMSTLSMRGTVKSGGVDETVTATGIWALSMDIRGGFVVGEHVVLGGALHTTNSGASTTRGNTRESGYTSLNLLGAFVALYPAPRHSGFHIGTALGWGLGVGGDISGTGPGLSAVLGVDTRGERWSMHAFDFRLMWLPAIRTETTRASGFAFGFQYGIGFR